MKKPVIVVSAANSTGIGGLGCLSVVKDCLGYLSTNEADRFEIVALVHKRKLFDIPNVTYLEYPRSCKSFLFRLYYENIAYLKLSKKLKPELWLSLVNLTPRVEANRQAVYCHNPCSLYDMSLREAFLQPRFALYNLLMSRAYARNILRNDFVIVQQEWIRKEFKRRFGVKRVVVAHPSIAAITLKSFQDRTEARENFRFFYPAFPSVYKNYELVIEAARMLRLQRNDFEICLTLDGTENRYARHIFNLCKEVPEVRLLGIIKREQVLELYRTTDCLLFPSKLETWGMPITEFKGTGRPMLVADLPYAYETVGDYERAAFFDAADAGQLADLMLQAMNDELAFQRAPVTSSAPQPFAKNWAELFAILNGFEAEKALSAAQIATV